VKDEVLSLFNGNCKEPIQCCNCKFVFLRNPKETFECTVCKLKNRSCEIWTANVLKEIIDSGFPIIATKEKSAKVKIRDKKYGVRWDFVIYVSNDFNLRNPILFIEVMEDAHFYKPNDRDDNKSIDNEITFKFRRGDYYKWMAAYQLLVPTLFITEPTHIEFNLFDSVKREIKEAYKINKIQCIERKRKEIVDFFQFPSKRMIPHKDYNQSEPFLLPWEAVVMCNHYNANIPIKWDLFHKLSNITSEDIFV